MRKIEQEMNQAIIQEVNWKKDNTEVVVLDNVIKVYLYGKAIAELNLVTNELFISSAGFPTRTTCSRLNALVGRFYRVNLKGGILILSKLDKNEFNLVKQVVVNSGWVLVS